MRKKITEFKKGELIRLYACDWQEVKENPIVDDHQRVWMAVKISGLRYIQIFNFDWREEFEVLEVIA